jgi:hypothetical protein
MFAKRKVKVKLRRRKIKKRGLERFWIGKGRSKKMTNKRYIRVSSGRT